ncbi:MAG TPA: hypothetical protein VFM71_08730 [Gemmatimonadaceae bacterium]|nr:hypothetical protein [Gemmatimonadaceae bacterium]
MARPIVIAVTSDQHAGSTVALCPPSVPYDDGGAYTASKAQSWVWECWQAYWARVAQVRRELKATLYQVFNGDAVEGAHHGTTQIISGNLNAQAAVWTAAVAIPLAMKPDKIFGVRGTEAHVGQSANAEERIFDGLRRDHRPVVGDPDTDTASWWHLRMELQGVLLDFAHHGRTGQREHTRAGAASLHAHDILLSHIKAGHTPPDLCIRSHYHRFNDSHDACPVRVVTIGAWQLKTGFVHKVAADSLADIGGAIIVIDKGAYTVEKVKFTPERGAVWTPAAA